MLDSFRENPRQTLAGIVERRQQRDSNWQPPVSVRVLEWTFMRNTNRRNWVGSLALRLLGAKWLCPNGSTSPKNAAD